MIGFTSEWVMQDRSKSAQSYVTELMILCTFLGLKFANSPVV